MPPPQGDGPIPVSGSLDSFLTRWTRLRGAWDLLFLLMLILVAWPVTTRLPGGPGVRLAASVAIVSTGLVYVGLGHASRRRDSVLLTTAPFVVGWLLLWTLTGLGLAAGTWPLYAPLLVQMWAALPPRTSVIMTLLGALGAAGSWAWLAAHRQSRPPAVSIIAEATGYAAALMVFSAIIGLLVTRLLREARQLASTVDELHQTQGRLIAAEREQGELSERQRVARDIHDTVAQGLISLVALSRAAQVAVSSGDEERARGHLRLIESAAVENLSETRIMVANLSPDHLQERTLAQALTRIVDLSNEEGDTLHVLTIRGRARPLGARKDITALRVAQEALSNVHRHASARHATVTLDYAPTAIILRIEDDGIGFDPDRTPHGFGLDGMSARITDVDGTFALTSHPGHGTALTVRIPA